MKVVHLDIKFWFIWNTKNFYYIRIDVNNTYKKPNRPHIKSFGHVGKTVSLCKVIQSEILRSNIEFKMKFFGLFLFLMAIVLLAAPDAVAAKKPKKGLKSGGKKGGKDQLNLSERKFSNFISLQWKFRKVITAVPKKTWRPLGFMEKTTAQNTFFYFIISNSKSATKFSIFLENLETFVHQYQNMFKIF